MIEKIVCGFQDGADLAGARAARAANIPVGGWIPLGFKTESGPKPYYAELYGAKEHPSPLYPPRTEANVRDSDATIWFGRKDSPGFKCTVNACANLKRPFFAVERDDNPALVMAWVYRHEVRTLNVAGNRASSQGPEFGGKVEGFLGEVFRLLRENDHVR